MANLRFRIDFCIYTVLVFPVLVPLATNVPYPTSFGGYVGPTYNTILLLTIF